MKNRITLEFTNDEADKTVTTGHKNETHRHAKPGANDSMRQPGQARLSDVRIYVVPSGIRRATVNPLPICWKISLIFVVEFAAATQVLLDPVWL